MPTLTVNGVPVAYSDAGPAGAPALVFGHGLLMGGWMFRAQIAGLSDRYRCIAVDWRGQGSTPPTASGYDMDTLTADAAALIEALALGPVHWVGLSMGGFVGQRLAARRPDLVRSLALLDTSARAEEPARSQVNRRLAWAFQCVGIRPLLSQVEPHLFGPVFLADPASVPVRAEWVRRLSGAPRTGVRKAVLGVSTRRPIEAELAAIDVPTLVVVGEHDRATPPAESERIVAGIRGARLEIATDCGHSSTLEQPALITRLLTEHLSRA